MSETEAKLKAEWAADCLRWRGRVLTGVAAHWCFDWDGLPIDETTEEWGCCTDLPDDLREAGERSRLGVGVMPDLTLKEGSYE